MTRDFVSAIKRYELEISQATLDYERRLSEANRRLSAAMLAFEQDRERDADARPSGNSSVGKR